MADQTTCSLWWFVPNVCSSPRLWLHNANKQPKCNLNPRNAEYELWDYEILIIATYYLEPNFTFPTPYLLTLAQFCGDVAKALQDIVWLCADEEVEDDQVVTSGITYSGFLMLFILQISSINSPSWQLNNKWFAKMLYIAPIHAMPTRKATHTNKKMASTVHKFATGASQTRSVQPMETATTAIRTSTIELLPRRVQRVQPKHIKDCITPAGRKCWYV